MDAATELIILWTSRDRETALNMVFMYAKNSLLKGWWERVTLLVWGPSAQLLSEDMDLQEELSRLKEAGVRLQACRACAERYGVASQLEDLGVEVRFMGQPLSQALHEGVRVLSV